MAKQLKKIFDPGVDEVVQNFTIESWHVSQSVDALTGVQDYDIIISGSLSLTGSAYWSGSTDANGVAIEFLVRDTSSGELYTTGSSAFDIKISGSFPAERLVITENTSSANAGGLTTNNNLRTWADNTGIVIGGSKGSNGVVGEGLIISETPSNGNHTIVSDGSGSNLNIRAAGGNDGDTYVVILADQAGSNESDIFEIAKFGGPLRSTELYHTGSLVFNTAEIGANKGVIITGTISASADAYLPGLSNTTVPHIVGFDTSSGQLTYYSTASFGGGAVDTGSFYYSSSVALNTITFYQGDGTTETLTVDTGSASGGTTDTGSFYLSSSVNDATITFTQGDGSTEQVTVNNVVSASYATTSSYALEVNYSASAFGEMYIDVTSGNPLGSAVVFHRPDGTTSSALIVSASHANNTDSSSYAATASYTPNAVVTASLAGSDLTFTKGDSSQFSLTLPGGGGGNPITGSYTGSVLTTTIQSINWTGSGVQTTVGGANDITVYIPGGSTDTGSFYYSSSVALNTITFYQGDGTTEAITVDTGSAVAINTGSFYLSSSVNDATITFTQGDGSTEQVTVNNVVSASYTTTASYVPNALITSSLTVNTMTYTKGDGTTYDIDLADLSVNNALRTAITLKNVWTGTISKGTPCYITASGTSGNVAGVVPADASDPTVMPAGVIAGEELTNVGDEGIGYIVGWINGVDTSAFASGDEVFVAVGGGYTNIAPTGSNLVQKLGNIEKSDAVAGSGVIHGPGAVRSVPNTNPGHFWVGDTDWIPQVVPTSSFVNTASFNALTASFLENIYNTNGSLTGNRTLEFNGSGLTFDALNGETFNISLDNSSQFNINLNTNAEFAIIDLADEIKPKVLGLDVDGVVKAMATSSIQNVVSSSYATTASYSPNLYNTNGTLTGDRTVTLGANNELRFAPGTGASQVRVSDGPSSGPFSYEIVMGNTGEFRVNSLSSSSFFTNVFVDAGKVLTLEPVTPLPSGVPIGSFAVSASTPPRPFMWDGSSWYAL